MTALTIAAPSIPVTSDGTGPRTYSKYRDVIVHVRRNLVHIAREPLSLSDVTVQPVLFTLLFIYVLGSGIAVHGGGYKEFAVAGLMLLNLSTSSIGTAVGLSTDITSGAIDRFRALPMWRPSVLIGRTISDLLSSTICVAIVAVTGLVIGWRTDASALSVVGGFAVILFFTYALIWACACFGVVSKGPESAQSMGLVVLFPLAIVSNAMVPTQGMPGWLRLVANWNPVSAVTAAARNLFGNPNPTGSVHAWPMQHPVVASLAWSVVMLVVFAPMAAALYRRRTTD
jgi:ABC transporter DrrB family efflux protein